MPPKFSGATTPVEFGRRRTLEEPAKKTTGVPGNSLVPVLADELERDVLHGDHDVERHSLVLQPQKITEGGLIASILEARAIDVFRVVVQLLLQPAREDLRQLAFGHDRDL